MNDYNLFVFEKGSRGGGKTTVYRCHGIRAWEKRQFVPQWPTSQLGSFHQSPAPQTMMFPEYKVTLLTTERYFLKIKIQVTLHSSIPQKFSTCLQKHPIMCLRMSNPSRPSALLQPQCNPKIREPLGGLYYCHHTAGYSFYPIDCSSYPICINAGKLNRSHFSE